LQRILLIGVVQILFISTIINAAPIFYKSRAKQMSNKSDNYRYIDLKNEKDLEKYNTLKKKTSNYDYYYKGKKVHHSEYKHGLNHGSEGEVINNESDNIHNKADGDYNKRSRYKGLNRWTKIDSKYDIKLLCKNLQQDYFHKRGTKVNWVTIENVTINCSDASVGVKTNGYSSGKIINNVSIKNTTIQGGNINLGIEVDKYKGETINSNMTNKVNANNANIEGTFLKKRIQRGFSNVHN